MKTTKRLKAKETEQRLSNIENSLREIESYLNTSKIQLNSLNQVVQGIEEIKQNTKQRRRISLFPPKLAPNPPKPNVTQQVTELLQNPLILNMLINTVSKSKPNSPSKSASGSKSKSANLLTNVDWTSILTLLQSPALQSMLQMPSTVTSPKKKQQNSNGINMSQVMKLIQDPALQSLLNKKG